jgi:hypothetical protein
MTMPSVERVQVSPIVAWTGGDAKACRGVVVDGLVGEAVLGGVAGGSRVGEGVAVTGGDLSVTGVEVDVDGIRVVRGGDDVSVGTAPTAGDWVAPQALTNIKSVTIRAMALDRARIMIPLFGADVTAVSGGPLA